MSAVLSLLRIKNLAPRGGARVADGAGIYLGHR